MPQPRNKRTEQLQRRYEAARLYLQGLTYLEIGLKLGVNASTICRDLQAVRKEWLESSIRDFDELKAKELAKLDEIERQAWEGWWRSRQDRETRIVEDSPAGRKSKLRRSGQAGDPRFLTIMLTCARQRQEILGLVQKIRPSDTPGYQGPPRTVEEIRKELLHDEHYLRVLRELGYQADTKPRTVGANGQPGKLANGQAPRPPGR